MPSESLNTIDHDYPSWAISLKNSRSPLDTACLIASIKSPTSHSERLIENLKILSKLKHTQYILILRDTAWRHNLSGSEKDHARKISLQWGDDWIAENEPLISRLNMEIKIIRHDEIIAMRGFGEIIENLKYVFKETYFEEKINIDEIMFKNRIIKRGIDIFSNSRDFIIEEIAADIIISRINSFTHYYPGPPLNSYRAIISHSDKIPEITRGLEKCIFREIRKGKSKYYIKEHNIMQDH